jgi:hypothetical protein
MKIPDVRRVLKYFSIFRLKSVYIPTAVLFPLFLMYLFGSLNYLEPTEIGIARNIISGNMWIQEGGIHVSWPWVWVSKIDTRPVRVAVNSAGHGYSAKLVQFKKENWQDFVALEGWRYWWWANRISFNFGYDDEYRGMRDIMRGYAYSPKQFPFLVVLEEYKTK